MKKFNILTLIFTLLLSLSIPTNLFAQSLDDESLEEKVSLVSEEEIIIYKDSLGSEQILSVPNHTTVTLLNIVNEEYSFIRYIDQEDFDNVIEGYVRSDYISKENSSEDEQFAEEVEESVHEEETTSVPKTDSAKVVSVDESDKIENKQTLQLASTSSGQGESLQGIARKDKTHVYESQSRNSKILKSYAVGTNLKYRSFSANWYIATVFLNGKAHTGYIHKDDVGESFQGYAQLEPTAVYAQTSKNSTVLKSYRAGHLLKYRSFNGTWYEATVLINGKRQTGYIHKDDVGERVPTLEGYAQPGSTAVYAQTSRTSKVLKSYSSGSLLKYRPHNGTWYEATVFINGQRYTGYIHKDDVGEKVATLQGYAQLSSTGVYASTSKGSTVLKSYRAGHLLKYRPYNDEWYEATVIINGTAHSGFIYKNDVGSSIPSLQGVAMKQSTPVYSSTSKNSKILKTYRSGHLLKYRPYNNSWYEATVFINGIAHTGYIHHGDVVNPTGKTVMLDAGHGAHDPGATANGLQEKNITLDLALRTQRMLENAGFTVIMTRATDTFLTLQERSALANSSNVDIFVSIHNNAGGGTGIETYWYDKYEADQSKALATALQEEMIKETNMNNRGVKNGNFHVIRETQMPSALVEVGFIDRKEDAEKLKQDSFLNQATKGIVNGIKKFFQMF